LHYSVDFEDHRRRSAMERNEIAPEFITCQIEQYASAYERLYNLTRNYHAQRLESMLQFHKEVDDICIQAGIPTNRCQRGFIINIHSYERERWDASMDIYKQSIM
ncbi:hypothetical protein PMAYCL1PPCAC_20484, partial [Pristionchus mayeri]